jgi:ubiquinone biosynthesis protein UbiJ
MTVIETIQKMQANKRAEAVEHLRQLSRLAEYAAKILAQPNRMYQNAEKIRMHVAAVDQCLDAAGVLEDAIEALQEMA